MQIAANRVVSIHYQVATAEGESVDASQPGEPLVYLHGQGQIIGGLERALLGKAAGDKVAVEVAPKDGYGEYDPELDVAVPLDAFPKDLRAKLVPGAQFHAEHPTKGTEAVFTVHKVEGGSAYCSGNHPLAGKTLQFKVEIADVRDATKDELSHGHAHGPGGHHHH